MVRLAPVAAKKLILWGYTLCAGRQPTLGGGGNYLWQQQGSMRSKVVRYFANTEASLIYAGRLTTLLMLSAIPIW